MATPRPIPSLFLDDTETRQVLIDRVVARIDWPEHVLDCWQWVGTLNAGYAQIAKSIAGQTRGWRVHRLTYAWWFSEDPYPLDIDHMCANTSCVNPQHLQAVTTKVNNLRSENAGTINARRTHCVHGHPLYGENLFMEGNKRRCKACIQRRSQKWYDENYESERDIQRGRRYESCTNGHPVSPENTYYRKSGRRECRVCHRNRERERSRKIRERKRRQSD